MRAPIADGLGLDLHTARLFLSAQAAGIPADVMAVNEGQTSFAPGSWVRLVVDGLTYFYRSGTVRLGTPEGLPGPHINGAAARITRSKSATKALLAAAGLPVSPGRTFDRTDREAGLAFAAQFSPAACLKRDDGTQGNLVFVNCRTPEEKAAAWDAISARTTAVLVERNVEGDVLRFFYVEPNLVGVRNHRPAEVVGDGRSRVRELVAATNTARAGVAGRYPILIDKLDEAVLDSVPASGATLPLALIPDVWSGGEHVSLRFEDIDPGIADIAKRAFESIPGLRIGGIDMIVPDLGSGGSADSCYILEINSSPGIATFHEPSRGLPQDVAGAILDLLRTDAAARRLAAAEAPAVTWSVPSPPKLDADAAALRTAAVARGIAATEHRAVDASSRRLTLELDAARQRYRYAGGSLRVGPEDGTEQPKHVNGGALTVTRSDAATRRLLKKAGLPVPETMSFKADEASEAVRFGMRMTGHALVRPDGQRTEYDVTARTRRALATDFQRASQSGRNVLVEEVPSGDELRLFYLHGQVVGAMVMRRPAGVADGNSSVLAIARRSPDVAIGAELVSTLARQGHDLQDVPPRGATFFLRDLPVRTRPQAVPVEAVHPSFIDLARRAAEAIPGFVFGTVAIRATDITAPAGDDNGTVLAVKSSPSISMFGGPGGNPVADAIVEWIAGSHAGAMT